MGVTRWLGAAVLAGIGTLGVMNPSITLPVPVAAAQAVVDWSLPRHVPGPQFSTVTITSASLQASHDGLLGVRASGDITRSGGSPLGKFTGEADLVMREGAVYLKSPEIISVERPGESKGKSLLSSGSLTTLLIRNVMEKDPQWVDRFVASRPVYWADGGLGGAVLGAIKEVRAMSGWIAVRSRPGSLIGPEVGGAFIAAGLGVLVIGRRRRVRAAA